VHAVVQMPTPYALEMGWLFDPLSHFSGPLTTPSPQYGASVQLELHVPYDPSFTPLSHFSPFCVWTIPSPHEGARVQAVVQMFAP
jgi:hypothetical protein